MTAEQKKRVEELRKLSADSMWRADTRTWELLSIIEAQEKALEVAKASLRTVKLHRARSEANCKSALAEIERIEKGQP